LRHTESCVFLERMEGKKQVVPTTHYISIYIYNATRGIITVQLRKLKLTQSVRIVEVVEVAVDWVVY